MSSSGISASKQFAAALFVKKSVFPNSLSRVGLQLNISRKSKYFLKWSHAIVYTRVYESMKKRDS
jgi:hypothetical protein